MKKLTCMLGLVLALGVGLLFPFSAPVSASEPPDIGALLKAYDLKAAWQYVPANVVEKRPWLNPARAALLA